MRPHLGYLKYVLLHKLYVFVAGVAVARHAQLSLWGWMTTLARLVIHDASKFRPSEWRPYVESFYGTPAEELAMHEPGTAAKDAYDRAVARVNADRRRAFEIAWLHHQHRNPHHWQHWLLKQDDGKLLTLMMPVVYVDEMVADWIGAGSKILQWPTLPEAVAETIEWYVANAAKMSLRTPVRMRVERMLLALADDYGLTAMASDFRASRPQMEVLSGNG